MDGGTVGVQDQVGVALMCMECALSVAGVAGSVGLVSVCVVAGELLSELVIEELELIVVVVRIVKAGLE